MNKKWSSFGEQQLLTENWREFLTEEVVELEESEEEIQERFRGKGGYVDRFKQSSKAFADKWKETRPKPMEDYPATELATILNMVYQAAGLGESDEDKATRDEIVKEFEEMLEAQNFVIKEQSEQLIFAEKPVLDLEKMPTLKAILNKIQNDNPDAFKQITSAFQRGGFKIGDAPAAQPAAAQQKQAQDDTPSADPEQAQAAAPAEEPEQAQAATVRVSPEEYFSKMNLSYTDPDTNKNYNLQKLALKMAQALNSDLGINERREPKEFPAVVEFFKTVKNSGIKKVLFKALADYLKATNFQIGKETIATLRPELSRDSSEQESSKTTDNIKNILKNDFQSEAFKNDFPQFSDYNFDQQYAAFVSDLKKLVSKVNEISRANMASALGVDKNEIVALAKKYRPIFILIARHQPGSEGQKAFLSDLLAVAKGKPAASKSDSGEPQQIDTTGASYAPTSGGLDAYSQGGEVEDIPSANQDKVEPDSIKMTADTAKAQDLDAYSGDAETTQDAEKEDKPAEEKPEKEKKTQSNEEIVKSELRKHFDGSDEEFEDAFVAFIDDLRKLKKLEEVGKTAAKGSMGITKTQYLEFEQKHQKIFDAINRVYKPVNRKNRAARQRFLDALEAISTTGSEASYAKSDKERLRQIASSDPSGEPIETDREIEEPESEYDFRKLYLPRGEFTKDFKEDYKHGKNGHNYMVSNKFYPNPHGRQPFASPREAYEAWNKLYDNLFEKMEKKNSVYNAFAPAIKFYLKGLQEWIENYGKETVSETLNESTMVRWKELAGIL